MLRNSLKQTIVEKRFQEKNFIVLELYDNAQKSIKTECHCGKIFYPTPALVFRGSTTSCGCKGKAQAVRNINKRSTIVTIKDINSRLKKRGIRLIGGYTGTAYSARFRCVCGKEFEANVHTMIRFKRKSCGCLDNRFQGIGTMSKSFWNVVNKSAKKRGIEIDITMQYAWSLFLKQKKKCVISGRSISFARDYTRNKLIQQTASLDRIDSSRGYVRGNVQWLHKRVNVMKGNMSDDDFVKLCGEIYKYNKK